MNIQLDHEIELYNSPKERERYEALAEIYSIIVTLDKLEKAFLKDSISHNEYTPACMRLLAQYNILLKNEQVAEEFGDLDSFKAKYNMSYANATARLRVGIPATVEHETTTAVTRSSSGTSTPISNSGAATSNVSSKAVAEATGNFITTMDGLKLNFRAKDQLHPLLSELMQSLNRVTTANFEGRAKIVEWLITLNQMKVNEELSDEQARQLMFDLDNAYKAFFTSLE